MDVVSIVTCTYNRTGFYENLKKIVVSQDYPHDFLEWIIVDDSPDSHASMFPAVIRGISVRYFHLKNKIPLGKKRDFINRLAKGKYIVNFDDDDYYRFNRISHTVEVMRKSGRQIAGGNIMFMYFLKNKNIYQLGPYGSNHATAATLAYTKEYTKTHSFFDPTNGNYGEESTFTNNWVEPMADLDPMTVLTLSHTDNTIEKTMFLEEKYGQVNRTIKLTDLKLENFMDEDSRTFYENIPYEYKVNEISKEVIKLLEKNITVATQESQTEDQHIQMIRRMSEQIQIFTVWKQKQTAFKIN